MVGARIAGAGDAGSPADFYNSLPPLSRAFGTASIGATALSMLGLLNPVQLYLAWELVGKKFQIWRLVTNFVFLGKFSFSFFMLIMMIARYTTNLEQVTFERRTDDFIYMNIFGMVMMLVATLVIPGVYQPFLGTSLIFMHLYLWSRYNHTTNVSIMGMVTLQAFYLPWAMTALSVIMGSSPIPDLVGIVVGHLYFFLADLYPRAHGTNILQTPDFVRRMVVKSGVGQSQHVRAAEVNVPRAFQGRGRRLGD